MYSGQQGPPPSYGSPAYGQPYYGQPPGQGYSQAPQTIIINNTGNEPTITNMTQMGKISDCAFCRKETDNVFRSKIGCVTIAWCLGLSFTGICCVIPFFVDSCKDTEVVCQGCTLTKTTVPANCC